MSAAFFSELPARSKGMNLVTDVIVKECQEGRKMVDVGIFTLSCLHTSAAFDSTSLRMHTSQLIK